MRLPRLFASIALIALAGCAGTPFPDRSVFIGEVVHVATPDEVQNGFTAGHDHLNAPKFIAAACDGDGKVLIVRYFQYWHNQASQIVRGGLKWAYADRSSDAAPGNLVEVELAPGKTSNQCPVVRAVRAPSLASADCEYRRNEVGAVKATLNAMSSIGGPGSASIHCAGLEQQGWKKVQVGPYDAFAWGKLAPVAAK